MIKDINNIDPRLLEEDERIVSFLKGKMPAEEEQSFMKELEKNPELKEKAIITARLVKGLKEVGSQRDHSIVDAFLASTEQDVADACKDASQAEDYAKMREAVRYRKVTGQEETGNAKVIPMRRAAKWLSVAASLVFIVWLGFEYSLYRSTIGLGEEYDDAFSSGMIVRGGETTSEAAKKLENLFADVKTNKNIDEAIHELSLCWEISTMETYNDYTDYSAEIGWYLAIAHLKDNDRKSAKKVLEKLIESTEDGAVVNSKAKELSDKL